LLNLIATKFEPPITTAPAKAPSASRSGACSAGAAVAVALIRPL
jgi:hypothetical protein